MGSFGATWCGKRFIKALESLGWESRLQRGRSYARAGYVVDLEIRPGVVDARVQGSRPRPYRVRIELEPLRTAQWQRVAAALVRRTDLIAALLDSELLPDIEAIFADAGAPLFPAGAGDLATSCTCPDWTNPCKHVAAVCYQVAEELDANPLLLLELRGRNREELLRDLHELRLAGGDAARSGGAPAAPDGREAVAQFWTAGPAAAALTFRCQPPAEPGAILQRLGSLPAAAGGPEALARLQEYFQAVGATAAAVAERCGLSLKK